MNVHQMIRKCLTKWMTDMDLWMDMRMRFDYEGSPSTLSRERRNVKGLQERSRPNKKGVLYKEFRSK